MGRKVVDGGNGAHAPMSWVGVVIVVVVVVVVVRVRVYCVCVCVCACVCFGGERGHSGGDGGGIGDGQGCMPDPQGLDLFRRTAASQASDLRA